MYRERTAGVPLNLWNVNRFYEMGEKEAFGVLSGYCFMGTIQKWVLYLLQNLSQAPGWRK